MDCKLLLQKHNLKITPARIKILEFLDGISAPVDSIEILSFVEKSGTNAHRATIFRSLSSFKEVGIVKAIQLNEGKYRYELSEKPEHHHILCTSCGAISDVDVCIDADMEKKIIENSGYKLSNHTLEFTGICPDCQ